VPEGKGTAEYRGEKNAGIFTANGGRNKSEEKRQELYESGKNLKKARYEANNLYERGGTQYEV
jgi:hypothetical protein